MRRSLDFGWFLATFGFEEPLRSRASLAEVQARFSASSDGELVALQNGRRFMAGMFTTPSVRSIREQALDILSTMPNVSVRLEVDHLVVGDVLEEHHRHPLSTFQAASQFNCLEFSNPYATPEDGITFYSTDRTQGPACALACPAGTLYRNYLARVQGATGQTAQRQLNNLDELEQEMGNSVHKYWSVRNGYTFSSEAKLRELNEELARVADHSRLVDVVKVGVQRDTEVVFRSRFQEVGQDAPLLVTQVYCSALSVAYSGVSAVLWEPLARIVLQAAYEATLWAGVLNFLTHRGQPAPSGYGATINHCDQVFLTFLGGGVFGNDLNWIMDSVVRAITRVQAQLPSSTAEGAALQVRLCHFRGLDEQAVHLLARQLPESFRPRT